VIVVDASAITELLLQTELGTRVERRLYESDEDLHAPHLIDVEVLSALRRLVRTGEVRPERAEAAIEDLASLRLSRHAHLDLATRVWELRQNFTAYDALYLALAESLNAAVVTCDRPFGTAPGHSVEIEVIRSADDAELDD
jgi:predicted nucleic acid-binding protein